MRQQAPQADVAAIAGEDSLLDQIVAHSRVARSDSEREHAKDIISELVREVMQGTVVVSDNLSVTLDARVAELDRLISEQLSEVMHHPDFQRLESSWTGLHYLCRHTWPLVVSCGKRHSKWRLVVVEPCGHVGKSRERLVHMSMGRG